MAIQIPLTRCRFVACVIDAGGQRQVVKTHTSYLTFNTKKRQEIIDITDEVEACRAQAGITEGFVLVSAMHISASVFVNDHEPGLWKDILDWLEKRVAPWSPDDYRHNTGTGEDNAAAHLRSLTVGHEVIVPVTNGRLEIVIDNRVQMTAIYMNQAERPIKTGYPVK